MRILVTGGAGFIGSNLVKRLAGDGHDTVAVDDFSSGDWRDLIAYAGDVRTIEVSENFADLKRVGKCDVIFHEASITDTTVHDQNLMMRRNVEGFRNVLDLAERWESQVVWASSAATYGRLPPPHAESVAPAPLNVYGYSKLAMERLAAMYAARLSHPIVGLRYFNVYGPGEAHKGKFASMICQLARVMRDGGRPRIFTDGEQRRDFVYIDDVVDANLLALQADAGGVFNVGSGRAGSFNEVVTGLNRVLGSDLPPEYIENPYDFFQTWTEADLTLSRDKLRYEPKYDLEKGLDAYLASGALGS